MTPSALIVCKAFLDQCTPDLQQGLVELFSKRDQHALAQISAPVSVQAEYLKWDLLDHVHFSWLAPFLRTLAENDLRLFLAAISKTQLNGLASILGFGNHLPSLTKQTRQSLRKLLLEQLIQNQELLSPAFLPSHPLNRLLGSSEKMLLEVIQFLGLHDLSFEMRQIIATATLKKIFAALPKKQGEFLNTLLLHQEPLVFKRLFMEKWDGTKQHLSKLIEERGIQRLGHALSYCHPSLTWYLTHRMDLHLGTHLLKHHHHPPHPRAEKVLTQQVENIIHIVKGSS